MAEAMARKKLGEIFRESISFDSAGTFAAEGEKASPMAVEVLADMGIDLSSHLSKPLSGELVDSSSLIVVMTPNQAEAVLLIDPGAHDKIVLFGDLDAKREGGGIEDPIGKGRVAYERIREELDSLVCKLGEFIERRFETGSGRS
jgi:protein-tyrosine-phosphatase